MFPVLMLFQQCLKPLIVYNCVKELESIFGTDKYPKFLVYLLLMIFLKIIVQKLISVLDILKTIKTFVMSA